MIPRFMEYFGVTTTKGAGGLVENDAFGERLIHHNEPYEARLRANCAVAALLRPSF